MGRIRVAIVGVGNSACVFLQGLQFYGKDDGALGLWHRKVADFAVRDIEVVAAFDIDARKVGLDLSAAAFTAPNTAEQYLELPPSGIRVDPGILLDKPSASLAEIIKPDICDQSEVLNRLEETDANVVLSTLSTGMNHSSRSYAQAAVDAGCCFVNCSPSPVACDEVLSKAFADSKLVVVGDDLMSQFGGTSFHRGILDLMHRRGVRIVKCYQLDVGGGMETLNTLDEEVRNVKRSVKTSAISTELPYVFETVAGTTDYVEYLKNSRTSYFWILGESFLGSPVKFDIYLRTVDGPNSGNVLLDVSRAVFAARNKGRFGAEPLISAYGFKHPPKGMKIDEAVERFSIEYVR